MAEVKAVEIRAELRQIKTMADHTVNVTLNVSEEFLPQAQVLMGWLLDEIGVVMVNATEEPNERPEKSRKIHI
jgi:hypothetical protein